VFLSAVADQRQDGVAEFVECPSARLAPIEPVPILDHQPFVEAELLIGLLVRIRRRTAPRESRTAGSLRLSGTTMNVRIETMNSSGIAKHRRLRTNATTG